METYTVVPRAGTYRVIATAASGEHRLVATCPTEQAAMTLLKTLQTKAGIPTVDHRRPKDWRL